jgi:hypothetical protein
MLAMAPIARADNTNDNSNTNNNSDVGGYLDSGSGSDESKNWPPTKLDWPPSDISTAGVSNSGKGGDSGSGKATPIVMPSGQAPVAKSDSDSTSTPPTPIVPAGKTTP